MAGAAARDRESAVRVGAAEVLAQGPEGGAPLALSTEGAKAQSGWWPIYARGWDGRTHTACRARPPYPDSSRSFSRCAQITDHTRLRCAPPRHATVATPPRD